VRNIATFAAEAEREGQPAHVQQREGT